MATATKKRKSKKQKSEDQYVPGTTMTWKQLCISQREDMDARLPRALKLLEQCKEEIEGLHWGGGASCLFESAQMNESFKQLEEHIKEFGEKSIQIGRELDGFPPKRHFYY